MTATAGNATATSAGDAGHPRRKLFFLIVAMSLAATSIDATIVSTALSEIRHDLDAPITWAVWTITGYNLVQVVVMPVAGKLADLYGPRGVFVAAASLYILVAIACGLAPNIYVLVALRTVQAIGGGAFMPAGSGIVAATFGSGRAKALGLFTSIFSVGSVLGPVIGGLVVHVWSWRAIFYCNLPLVIASVVLGAIFLPKTRTKSEMPLDVVGALQMACMLLCAMFAVTMLGNGAAFNSGRFLLPLLAGLVAFGLFAWHTITAEHPFVPPRLLGGRGFASMNLVNVLLGAFAIGTTALLPLFAQDRYAIDALGSGSLLSLRALGMASMTGVAVMVLQRTGYRWPIISGIVLMAIGLGLVSVQPTGAITPYLWLSLAAGVTGLGMGIAMPAANNATLHLSQGEIAAISGLRGMFRQAGGIATISIITAFAARSPDPGHTLALAFAVLAVVALCVVPLAWRVPEDPSIIRR